MSTIDETPPKLAWASRRMLPLGVLLVVGLILVIYAGGPRQIFADVAANREWLNGFVDRHRFAAALGYMVIFAGLILLLWVPPWLCTVIGGFLFGIWFAAPLALAAKCTGGCLVFALAQRGFGGLTERAGPFVRRLETGFQRDAVSYLVALRLIPLIPFVAINVGAAVLGVSLRAFAFATFVGLIPSTLIYVSIGDALGGLADGDIALDSGALLQPRFVLPLVGLAVLALLPALYHFILSKRLRSPG